MSIGLFKKNNRGNDLFDLHSYFPTEFRKSSMEILNHHIIYVRSGIIVTFVDHEVNVQPFGTEAIWRSYPDSYRKFKLHLDLQNWKPGRIQPVKINDSFWICNFAGKKKGKLDVEALEEGYLKLKNWIFSNGMHLEIPLTCDFSDLEWDIHIEIIRRHFKEFSFCLFNSKIDMLISKIRNSDFAINQITESLQEIVLSQKAWNVKTETIRSSVMYGTHRLGESYVELISLEDLLEEVQYLFRAVYVIHSTVHDAGEFKHDLIKTKISAIEIVRQLNIYHKLRRSRDHSYHQGIDRQEALSSLLEIC